MMSVDIMLNSEITHLSKMLTDTSRGQKDDIGSRGFLDPSVTRDLQERLFRELRAFLALGV